jgi:hypothetical protein
VNGQVAADHEPGAEQSYVAHEFLQCLDRSA